MCQDAKIPQFPARLPKKHGLSGMRLYESDGTIGTQNGDGYSGEAGTRTNVHNPQRIRRKMDSEEKRLAVVTLDGFLN